MIASGHPPAAVWEYTLPQVWAFVFIAGRRRKRDLADMLSIHALGASGDAGAIKRQLSALDLD